MSLINHPKLSNHLCIFFDKLEFQTSIGIHEHEMRKKQSVIICIEMYFPLSSASPKKDSISEVLDYDTIREGIEKIVNRKHFYLQETLINEISSFCIKQRNVTATRIKIAKKNAYKNCEAVGIELVSWK